MKTISARELENIDALIIDTRTPNEFAQWNIPGAINIPLFSNEERAVIGTLFTQTSRAAAIAKGHELVDARKEELLQQYLPYKDKQLVVHCWRGGLRSKEVCLWLEEEGFNVLQLQGGIKEHRKMVREELAEYTFSQKLVVLWGKTGTGKTKLIAPLEHALDLEALAQHRASAFGALGKQPCSQKNFESLLLNRLKELEKFTTIIVEGEAQKIGQAMIPSNIYQQLLKGEHYLLTCPLALRVQTLVEEYACVPDEQILACLEPIKKHLEKKTLASLREHLAQKAYGEFVEILLQRYYDPLYAHTLENRTYQEKLSFKNIATFRTQLQDRFPATPR